MCTRMYNNNDDDWFLCGINALCIHIFHALRNMPATNRNLVYMQCLIKLIQYFSYAENASPINIISFIVLAK